MTPDIIVWRSSAGDTEYHFYLPGEKTLVCGFSTEYFTQSEITTLLQMKGFNVPDDLFEQIKP